MKQFDFSWNNGLLALCCSVFITTAHATSFEIHGIKSQLRENVKTRLTELDKVTPLEHVTRPLLQEEIKKALYPYGYFKPEITVNTATNHKLIITIEKGPQIRFSDIDITLEGEGKNSLVLQRRVRKLSIKPNEPFDSNDYEKAKQSLMNTAQHQGYLYATYKTAELIIDKTNYTSQVIWKFDTGPRYYFGQIKFDPTYICPELLHRYIHFHYGQPFSVDKLTKLNSNLSGNGYFKSVSVKSKQNENTHYVPIDVHLQPVNQINYSVGAGYGTDTGPRGRLGIHITPTNRSGDKFNLAAQGSITENALRAQYLIPGHDPLTEEHSLNAGATTLNYSSGYAKALSASIAYQKTLPRYFYTVSINTLYEDSHYTGLDSSEKHLVYPKGIVNWKYVTDALFSPSGFSLTLSGLAASRSILLSDLSVSQAMIDAKAALQIPLLRTRFLLHASEGITETSNITQLPLSLALLLGGSQNMKGYGFNSIGPGKRLTYTGFEVQKETVNNWYITGFFDRGDVYQPARLHYKYDVGGGLMWVSPVGPIRVGFAQPVTHRLKPVNGEKPRLIINMGPDL